MQRSDSSKTASRTIVKCYRIKLSFRTGHLVQRLNEDDYELHYTKVTAKGVEPSVFDTFTRGVQDSFKRQSKMTL